MEPPLRHLDTASGLHVCQGHPFKGLMYWIVSVIFLPNRAVDLIHSDVNETDDLHQRNKNTYINLLIHSLTRLLPHPFP